MTFSKKNKKIALISGVTGQDGAYLSKFLIEKGYIVHGIKRRSSSFNTMRLDYFFKDLHEHEQENPFFLHHGDMTDSTSVLRIVQKVMPDEIYNLAAQSHVAVSFEQPEYTANCDALGTLRILEAIKSVRKIKKIKFYQASTSELYGDTNQIPQNEQTPFNPRSPYAIAKQYAHYTTINYREAYDIFACNGILFNHESPLRGETFVTKKITRGLSRIKMGLQKKIILGNLYSKRDWGHTKDYVEAQWLMMQNDSPEDFVIATQHQKTVKEFLEACAKKLEINISWQGDGINEKGFNQNGNIIVEISKNYFRKTDVNNLLGDASKAKEKLNWTPKISFNELIDEMIEYDLNEAKNSIR